jgi:hypothetical protein
MKTCTGLLVALSLFVTPASPSFLRGDLRDQLDVIQTTLEELVQRRLNDTPKPMVPFAVEVPGGLCTSQRDDDSTNPRIIINGTSTNGNHEFVVNSVLIIKTGGRERFSLELEAITIDGTRFDTKTDAILDRFGGAADLMGMGIRTINEPMGGNVPHQIVASTADNNDVQFTLFCQSSSSDFGISTVRVSGWKNPNDVISVSWIPGD